VALSHYCCRTTLQYQCHKTVLKLSIDRVRQPKQYSLEFAAEGEQGRHVPDMTRQRIPGSCCNRRKCAVTQCRTTSCRHQQGRRVSRSEMMMRRKAGNWTNGLGKVAWCCAVKTAVRCCVVAIVHHVARWCDG